MIFWPAISPDGKRFAFYSNRSGSVNLWWAAIDGSNPVQLTNDESDIHVFNPEQTAQVLFSPDNKYLCYVKHQNLWIFDIAGDQHYSLTSKGQIKAFSWSPRQRYHLPAFKIVISEKSI